ncbi:hypothetical protein Kpol_1053p18 [Vanderwaltozyma polyspora DSM 70294]|uniref:Required for respiratory growth protein 1, mitochondrial n=1 Tax=Vanderwaltozyma polyspora (strain ATCC 22028 / DSM 70294 / BCRC 21397 / CBS 2163 / NBRC 10782 / NRRL Y-8283 / UCD 57-17) TaxID=436907 RepID=RRG1_VANPO|nr:uncharacterized protein Kpol_1053p18 [Vanderwaltozyma polyspora DSM 70294]A7TN63.1 RecName: Full=Required for respiratory growth protein 1, mitochondrial [Vanderwaltozyma polyspora DSM 70294]EDO16281.1 hypothetical protein Kpol_1053p18 [Vanderwaltozyma polyspora DSM 70294]
MTSHFSSLPAHRSYIFSLYRDVLRNIHRCCYSVELQNILTSKLNLTMKQQKGTMSSWKAHSKIKELEELNDRLINRDLPYLKELINNLSGNKINSTQPNQYVQDLKEATNLINEYHSNNSQSIETIKKMDILNRYIKTKQSKHLLPKEISNVYKESLLLPFAIHEDSIYKLNKLHNQLIRGPPRVRLTNTKAGKITIWFLRSALNKKDRQSKKLKLRIAKEKQKHQQRIDNIKTCEKYAYWALLEASWESLLNTGKLPTININKTINNLSTLDNEDININRKNNHHIKDIHVKEWIEPITYSIKQLVDKEFERKCHYENYKKIILYGKNNGLIDFFENKTKVMYARRVSRYKTVVNGLPFIIPTIPRRDLRTALLDNKVLLP